MVSKNRSMANHNTCNESKVCRKLIYYNCANKIIKKYTTYFNVNINKENS